MVRCCAAPPALRASGMTLIEILVVVVIIGILAFSVTIAIGTLGGDTEVDDEAQRIADVISVALDQAELEGRDYGLRLEPGRYEVMVFDGRRQGWTAAPDDRWFRRHDLPPGLAIDLEIDGRRVLLRPAQMAETLLPQVVTSGSGDVTPYRMTIARSATGARTMLTGAVDGAIEITRDGPR